MSITNRDLDVGGQKEDMIQRIGGTSTGASAAQQVHNLWVAPFPCEIRQIKNAVNGISGTPLHKIGVYRFAAGGATTIVGLHTSIAVQAVATSGPQFFSLVASGNSLLNLQTNDVVVLLADGQDSAVSSVTVSLVVKKLQDIVSHYGVQT